MSQAAHPALGVPAAYVGAQTTRRSPYLIPTIIALTTVAGARAHEFIPLLWPLHLVLVLAYLVAPLLLLSSPASAIREALRARPLRVFIALMAWAAIGVPFSVYAAGAITGLQAFIPAVILMALTLVAPSTVPTLDRLQAGFVAGCSLTAFQALIFGRGGEGGRLGTGGTLDPNDLAAMLAMAIPLALGLIVRVRGTAKLKWIAAATLMIAVYASTGSRGGTIALVLSTVLFVLGQRGQRRAVLAAITIVAAIVTWNFAPQTLRDRMTSLVRGEKDYNETEYTGRKAIWARARGYIAERPVFGVGVTNFPVMEGQTCRRLFPGQGCKWSATHNSYLQVTAELGIPGGILFVVLLGTGFVDGWRLWRPRPGVRDDPLHRPEFMASLGGFAAAATFLSLGYFHLTFALIALTALARRTRDLDAAGRADVARGRLAVPDAGQAIGSPSTGGRFASPRRLRGGLATGRFHSRA
jgi:O-antigen ligase